MRPVWWVIVVAAMIEYSNRSHLKEKGLGFLFGRVYRPSWRSSSGRSPQGHTVSTVRGKRAMNDCTGDFLCSYASQGSSPGNEAACLASVWFSHCNLVSTVPQSPLAGLQTLSIWRLWPARPPPWAFHCHLGDRILAHSEPVRVTVWEMDCWHIQNEVFCGYLSAPTRHPFESYRCHTQTQHKGHLSDLKIFMPESVSWCEIFYSWHQNVSHLGWF